MFSSVSCPFEGQLGNDEDPSPRRTLAHSLVQKKKTVMQNREAEKKNKPKRFLFRRRKVLFCFMKKAERSTNLRTLRTIRTRAGQGSFKGFYRT